jgi:eukaryotic-like serine/threonine-protein kinase
MTVRGTPEHWARVKAAFSFALGHGVTGARRAVWHFCGDDAALRAEVESLVDAHFELEKRSQDANVSTTFRAGALAAARFMVVGHIGSGGFGDVYRVVDSATGSELALKVLRQVTPSALASFKREFRTLADIRHPNLVVLEELVCHDEHWMFTMECVDGVDLIAFIHRTPPQERDQVVRACFARLADGLHALHQRGVLHCDLKPSNVLVTASGRVVVLDFGLVLPREWASEPRTWAGTPDYMSPEQARGDSLGPESDWYALGVMLYQAFSGRLPFEGGVIDVLHQRQVSDPPPLALIAPNAPPDLNDLCKRLLARSPYDRLGYSQITAGLTRARPQEPLADTEPVLVGRETELRLLLNAYERSANGPVVVHLQGPSGIGKSEFIRTALSAVRKRNSSAVVLPGRCYSSESVPYKGVDEVIDHLSRHLRRLSREHLEQLLPRNFGVLERMFPALQIAGRRVLTAVAPLDAAESRLRAFAALRELFGRLAERARIVVVIDDFQWGGMDSAALLQDLVFSADAPALLLIVAYRSDDLGPGAWLSDIQRPGASRAETTRVALEPLRAADIQQIVSMAPVSAFLGRSMIDRIAEESTGNPFLVHEILRWLRKEHEAAHTLADDFTAIDVIGTRLHALGAEERALLEIVAVAGQPMAERVLHHVPGLRDVRRVQAATAHARLTRLRITDGIEEVEVYHDRIRTAVVETLDPAALRACHLALADASEAAGVNDPERLALHFAAGGDAERACDYALRAAQRATAALAFNNAAAFYTMAIGTGRLRDEAQVVCRVALGDALANAGRGLEASREYLRAADVTAGRERARLVSNAAGQMMRCGEVRRGIALLDELLQSMRLSSPTSRRLLMWRIAIWRTQIWLRGAGGRSHESRSLSDGDRLRLNLLWTGAMGFGSLDVVKSAEFAARHLLLALKTGNSYHIALGLAAYAAHARSERRARMLLERAANHAGLEEAPHAEGFITLVRAILAYLHGRWVEASECADTAAADLRSRCSNVAWELTFASVIGFIARTALGEWAENRRRLPALIRDAESRGDINATHSLRVLGCCYTLELAADRPDAALKQLNEDLQTWPNDQYDLHRCNALLAKVDIDLYAGRPSEAWESIEHEWPRLEASLFLRSPPTYVFSLHGRARAALAYAAASATGPGLRRQLLARVASDTDTLRRRGPQWCEGLVALLQSGLATFEEDWSRVRWELSAAFPLLDDAGLFGYATAACCRLAAFEGGEHALKLMAVSEKRFRHLEVVCSQRALQVFSPGLYERHV